MAERRMFSRRVLESDAFRALPAQTQMLYVRLCLTADDEGVIDNLSLLAPPDSPEVRELEARGWLARLREDLWLVVHWNVHNVMSHRTTLYARELGRFMRDNAGVARPVWRTEIGK